jgi:hypothetical protein
MDPDSFGDDNSLSFEIEIAFWIDLFMCKGYKKFVCAVPPLTTELIRDALTTSERLAVKRSLRDMEQISAANKACESLSNKSFRLEAVLVVSGESR